MYLSRQIIFEVNQIFHDIEAQSYDERHDEICSNPKQVSDWIRFAQIINANFEYPVSILDFGTGTGFVPSVIIDKIRNIRRFVCCDISSKMLEIARSKLPEATFKLLEEPSNIPYEDMAFDVITVNSVLHHVFDVQAQCKEFDRILSPGGLIIISNENNNRFVRNNVLLFFRKIGSLWLNGINKMKAIFCTVNCRKIKTDLPDIFDKVNEELIQRGLIQSALSPGEIQSIVDFHSPTASGRTESNKGFDPLSFSNKYFPGYEQILLETYGHFEVAVRISSFSTVDRVLRRLFPLDGKAFSVVLRKPNSDRGGKRC